MANQPPPQKQPKGQRRILDARWIEHLSAGGDPGDGRQLTDLVSFHSGISEFNQGKFFDAHESFERAWHAVRYPDRLLSLALSKLGAALTHAQRGNLSVARKIVHDTQLCLVPLPAVYAGIDVAELREHIRAWLASPQLYGIVIHRSMRE